MEDLLRILRTSTALTPAYEIALAAPYNVGQIIEHVHGNWLPLRDGGDAKKYFDVLMQVFNMRTKYAELPWKIEDRGTFYTPVAQGDLRAANEQEIKNSEAVICFGIDTNGVEYLEKNMAYLKPLLTQRNQPVAFHYSTSPEARAIAFEELVKEGKFSSEESRQFSNRVFGAPTARKRKLYIGHSFAVPFWSMAEYAYEISGGEDKLDALCFGGGLYWDDEARSKSKMVGRELSIIAADDMLPHIAANNLYLLHETSAAMNGALYRAFYNRECGTKDRVMVVLAPGVIGYFNEQKDAVNFGGHNLGFYMDGLGLTEKDKKLDPALEKLREAIFAVAHGEDRGMSLGDFLGATPYIKGMMPNRECPEYLAGITTRLLLENAGLNKVRERNDPEHLFTRRLRAAFTRT